RLSGGGLAVAQPIIHNPASPSPIFVLGPMMSFPLRSTAWGHRKRRAKVPAAPSRARAAEAAQTVFTICEGDAPPPQQRRGAGQMALIVLVRRPCPEVAADAPKPQKGTTP